MISCILFGNMILINLFLGLISFTFDRMVEDSKNKQLTDPNGLNKASGSESRLKLDGEQSGDLQAPGGGAPQGPKDPVQPDSRDRQPADPAGLPPPKQEDPKADSSADAPADLSNIRLVEGDPKETPEPKIGEDSPPQADGVRPVGLTFEGKDLDQLIAEEKEPLRSVFRNIKKGGVSAFMARLCLNRYFSALRVLFIVYNSVALGLVK